MSSANGSSNGKILEFMEPLLLKILEITGYMYTVLKMKMKRDGYMQNI